MLLREDILAVLSEAQRLDQNHDLFGASYHQYQLNPPIDAAFVRDIESQYGFQLPEDYFHFITTIGDGGAGPDYGIAPFGKFLEKAPNPQAEEYWRTYRQHLAKDFAPRPMQPEELADYAITNPISYECYPKRYFIDDTFDQSGVTDGFFILGTHGCQWDFGLILSGEKRGQIFDTDNEGAYSFIAASFERFYQNWLDFLSDKERFLQALRPW